MLPDSSAGVQALGCAPLQQSELQPYRRGGEHRRQDDEDAERDQQVGAAAVRNGHEREAQRTMEYRSRREDRSSTGVPLERTALLALARHVTLDFY